MMNSQLRPIKTATNSFGRFDLFRYGSAQDFDCSLCAALDKPAAKRSKLTAEWTTTSGKMHTICNGCFGTMLSLAKTPNQNFSVAMMSLTKN